MIPAPLATAPTVEGLAAERATGKSTARHRAPRASRWSASPGSPDSPGLILAPLATGAASDHPTGIGLGAAAWPR